MSLQEYIHHGGAQGLLLGRQDFFPFARGDPELSGRWSSRLILLGKSQTVRFLSLGSLAHQALIPRIFPLAVDSLMDTLTHDGPPAGGKCLLVGHL